MNKGYYYFIFARVMGLSTKPLMLLYLTKYADLIHTQSIASIYLYLGSLIILFSVPVHFDFYKKYFSNYNLLKSRSLLREYISSLINHYYAVFLFIYIFLYIVADSFFLSFFVLLLLFTEKLFDEIQRFIQFSKKFVLWSNIFLTKQLTPFICTILSVYFQFNEVLLVFILSVLLINIVVAILFIPKFMKAIIVKLISFNLNRMDSDYKITIKENDKMYYLWDSVYMRDCNHKQYTDKFRKRIIKGA